MEIERQKEIDAVVQPIIEKYKPKFKELEFTFNIKEIEDEGWVRMGRYYPRGSRNEYEYEKRLPNHHFHTRGVTIDFNDDGTIKQIFTNSGCPTRTIIDMEDLQHYFETNE